ncbi:MAG: hypothetical protein ACE5F1_01640 [Planctomycetota bacterium]
MKGETTTTAVCRAFSAIANRSKDLKSGSRFSRALTVSSHTRDAQAATSAGSWVRETRRKITTTAYVTNYAAACTTQKTTVIAQATRDGGPTPSPHVFKFHFTAPSPVTGTLTLTLSGCGSPGTTASYEIAVEGNGPRQTLTWSCPQRLRRKTLENVTIGASGLVVYVSSFAVATIQDRGRKLTFGRASVRFEVLKAR